MDTKLHSIILLFLCYISTLGTAVSQNTGNLTTSKIKDGLCVKGLIYRVDCNTCHCVAAALLCTKMACIKTPSLKRKQIRRSDNTCTPGEFSKDGCRRCFCNHEERLICGKNDCSTVGKLPNTQEDIQAHSSHRPGEQHLLPTLPYQSAQCNPGFTYRVDCNTCLCLANGNLVCGRLLCPSHDDVHTREAKRMSGKPCDGIGLIDQDFECVQCLCENGTNVCQAILGCVPMKSHVPLEPKSPGLCTPGMLYKRACNRCYCNKNRFLRCTLKNCLNESQFNYLDLIRSEWIDYTRRAGKIPFN